MTIKAVGIFGYTSCPRNAGDGTREYERASVYKITVWGKEDFLSPASSVPLFSHARAKPRSFFFLPRNCSRDGEPADLLGRKLR